MILSGASIKDRCTKFPRTVEQEINNPNFQFTPMIEPFVERTVVRGKSYGLSYAGYDIRLDKIKHERFSTDGQQDGPDSSNPHSGSGLESVSSEWSFRMMPGDFVLASSVERIKMPNDLIAFVKDKSSWAREGLAVQNTVLEPGWEGYITLELSFHRPAYHIVIRQGDPIAQVIFQKLDRPTQIGYTGKYQNQPNQPVEAREEVTNV